jgi:hypothetical protein
VYKSLDKSSKRDELGILNKLKLKQHTKWRKRKKYKKEIEEEKRKR